MSLIVLICSSSFLIRGIISPRIDSVLRTYDQVCTRWERDLAFDYSRAGSTAGSLLLLREHLGNKMETWRKKSIRHRSPRTINEPFTNKLAFTEF